MVRGASRRKNVSDATVLTNSITNAVQTIASPKRYILLAKEVFHAFDRVCRLLFDSDPGHSEWILGLA
jgi:hypothetical protein